jgi:hypothetical protein
MGNEKKHVFRGREVNNGNISENCSFEFEYDARIMTTVDLQM